MDQVQMMEAFTRQAIVEMALRLSPKDSLALHNGDQARACSVGEFRAILEPDGSILPLERVDGKFGALYVRVSTAQQRSRIKRAKLIEANTDAEGEEGADGGEDLEIDLDQKATALSREEMRGKPLDGYSEQDQMARGIEHFIKCRQSFVIFSDAGISGGWPWYDPHLIHEMFTAKARRYCRIFTKMFLDDPKYSFEDRESARAYLHHHIEEVVATVEHLDPKFEAKYIRAERRKIRRRVEIVKYRPGLTQLVRKMPLIHTIATADLSRLMRSYDIQLQLAKLLERHDTKVVGTFENLAYLNSSADDDPDASFGDAVQGFVMARIAETRLYEVMSGSIRGIVGMLSSGLPHSQIPRWIRWEGDHMVIDEQIAAPYRRMVELYQEGHGWAYIASTLNRERAPQPGKAREWHRRIVKQTVTNPALVGDQRVFGIRWRGIFPPLLVDENGRPDYHAFDKMQHKVRTTGEEYRASGYETHNSERRLGAGLWRCVCGKTMKHTHRHPPAKATEKARTVHSLRCAGNSDWVQVTHPHRIVSIDEGNMREFLLDLIKYRPEMLLGVVAESRERDQLAEEVATLSQKVKAKSSEIRRKQREREEQAEQKASDLARREGLPLTNELVRGILVSLARTDEEELAALESMLDSQRRHLETYVAPSQIASLQERLARAATMDEKSLNELLRALVFFEFETCTDGTLKLWMYFKTRKRDRRIEVPLRITEYTNGKRRIRLPRNSAEWIDADEVVE